MEPQDSTGGKTTIHDEPAKRSALRSVALVAACTLAMIANTSASTTISVALPTIARSLHINDAQLQWVMSGYPLTSGCLLLLFGRIADLYGRKKAFLIGSAWMLAFSLGCAFARDRTTLDILRALQGIGSAATIPASLGILANAFPPSRARSIAFATFSAGAPVGGAFGMLLGAVVTQLTEQTWRSSFYLIAGIVALSGLLGVVSIDLDRPSPETDRRVDWLGGLLVTAGLVLIVFVLAQGESAPKQWSSPYIIVLLILGVLLIFLFVLWQRYLEKVQKPFSRTPPPLMSLSLWTRDHGRVTIVFLVAFLNWCSFLGWSYWAQLYYQNYSHYSPIKAVIRFLPMFVTGIICNVVVALVVGHIPVIFLIGFGTALTSTASLLFAVISPSASYWAFGFPAAIVAVVGADFVFAAGTLYVAKVSLPEEQSVAGGLFQTMTQIGTSVGITISTVVFDRVLLHGCEDIGIRPNPAGTNAPPPVQLSSYHAAQWSTFGFGVLATLLAVIFFRGVGIVGEHKGQLTPATTEEKRDVESKGREQKEVQ